MITERTLARGFSSFWQELLPLLTPRFMRVFNESYTKVLKGRDGKLLKTVEVGKDNHNSAIVAEMAFFLAKAAIDRKLEVCDAVKKDDLVTSAAAMASRLVDQYEGVKPTGGIHLSMEEQAEACEIALSYDAIYRHYPDSAPSFNPGIRGAGFLMKCEADLAIGNTLFEIKTVNRNIGGKDLRQLIVYLALQAATGDRKWLMAGFFNPRRGAVAEFSVDNILFRLSGGKTPSQVFDELIRFLSTRDTDFDASF